MQTCLFVTNKYMLIKVNLGTLNPKTKFQAIFLILNEVLMVYYTSIKKENLMCTKNYYKYISKYY